MGKLLIFGIIAAAIILLFFFALITVLIGFSFGGKNLFSESIAIIPIYGEISSEPAQFSQNLSSNEIVEKIDQAEKDAKVAAILFDIDSPGGSIVATKNIVAKIRETKKPTLAYINDIGASGALYVAVATDFVFADEDSITGSIGVISIVTNYTGLLEKIGIDVNVFTEGKNKAMGSPFSEFLPAQKELLQELLKESFEHFKRDILAYRSGKIDALAFSEIADGRIISGTKAKKIGLIDETGTKQDAIRKAAALGNIKGEPAIKTFSKTTASILDIFSGTGYSFGFGFKKAMLSTEQGILAK